jgi:hypothetical protein
MKRVAIVLCSVMASGEEWQWPSVCGGALLYSQAQQHLQQSQGKGALGVDKGSMQAAPVTAINEDGKLV